VDESVCPLQDGSFQVSLGREGAVPVWLGVGWLETNSGELPQSEQGNQHCLGLQIDLELLDCRCLHKVPLLNTRIRNSASTNRIVVHHTLALRFCVIVRGTISGSFMSE
jgi:hypothetical protein